MADEVEDNSVGNTIETSIKIVTSDAVGARIIYTDDVYTETLIILDDRIQLLNSDVYYLMDTTDTYHKYTISFKNTAIKVYVDNVLKIESTLSVSGGTKDIQFGHYNNIGDMVSRWEYISYTPKDCVPLDPTSFSYALQTDSVSSFDSSNLRTYSIIDGDANLFNDSIAVGYSLTIPPRSIYQEYPIYWRVRIFGTDYISPWTDYKLFTREKNTREDIFNRIYTALPDDNVYSKDTSSGNVALLQRAQATEIAKVDFELKNILKDLSYEKTRETYLFDVLGLVYKIGSLVFNNFIEYRKFLINLFKACLISGTQKSIEDTVKTLTGVTPVIKENFEYSKLCILTSTGNPRYVLLDSDYPNLGNIVYLLSERGNAFTWELHIPNPFGITYNTSMLYYMIKKIKPVYSQVNMVFYNERGVPIVEPSYYGISNYGDVFFY